jgi:hypothetical protein
LVFDIPLKVAVWAFVSLAAPLYSSLAVSEFGCRIEKVYMSMRAYHNLLPFVLASLLLSLTVFFTFFYFAVFFRLLTTLFLVSTLESNIFHR